MESLALRLGFKERTRGRGDLRESCCTICQTCFPTQINLDPTAKQIQDSQRSKVGQDAVSDHDNCISRKQFGTSYSNAD